MKPSAETIVISPRMGKYKFHAFFDGRIPSITNPPQTNVRDMFPASPMEGSDTVEKNSDFCGTRSGAEEIWRAAARK